jgi:TatD DNase family protein
VCYTESRKYCDAVMIDSHIHLDADQYADVVALIKRARNGGVNGAVAVGVTPASNRRVMELAVAYPDFVYAAIGFHPERFDLTDEDVETTLDMIGTHRQQICAIGEVGLPYYGEMARREEVLHRARKILGRFARLATELDLPLILHCPHRTAADALSIIEDARVRRAVFHWHKSDAVTTRAILEAGYFISLTPEVVYRDRDQELAGIVPLDQMMVETDGPWPYGGAFEGKATEPYFLADVVSAIATIRAEPLDTVAHVLAANARTLFGIAA